MSNSKLATVKVPASTSNYTKGRSKKISKITIHHMAGKLTAKKCGQVFQDKSRGASAHYGIGSNGKIGLYVDEENTAWTDGNRTSNHKSVTIEVANSKTGGNWPVSDKSLKLLIKLCADIAKRNGLGKLVAGKNLTWHSMYANTTCCGNHLRSKMEYIAQEANKLNESASSSAKSTSSSTSKSYRVRVSINDLYIRKGPNTSYGHKGFIKPGVYTIVKTQGKWGKLKSGAGWICLEYVKKL